MVLFIRSRIPGFGFRFSVFMDLGLAILDRWSKDFMLVDLGFLRLW